MNNETKVRALLASSKSSEDIVKFLVMNDDYRTGPEARTALETFMTEAGLVPHKKVPMSEQYMTWYKALSRKDKLAQTKDSLHTQAVAIGMSVKSADWYARVYLLAGSLALEMSEDIPFEYAEAPIKTKDDVMADINSDPEYKAWFEALTIKNRKVWILAETGKYHGDYSEACFKNAEGADHCE
jgi:hypothetical protein